MKSRAANKMKQLCWGLALLALVQPALSLDCPCVCDSHREGIPAEDETAASHCQQGGAPCCHHDHAERGSDDVRRDSKSLSVLALVEFHDCQCPSDCDCQWQHSDATAVEISSKTANRAWRLTTSFSDCSYFTRAPLPQELPGNSREREGQLVVSAQSACAVLCRFLS